MSGSGNNPAVLLYDANGNPLFTAPGTAASSAVAVQGITSGLPVPAYLQGQDGYIAQVFQGENRLRVNLEGTQLFDDTFDTGLDTANRWNTPVAAGGGVAATNVVGQTVLSTGTTANGYSYLTSQNTFLQAAPGWLKLMVAATVPATIPANTYAFWGFGTPNATPTAAAPFSNAIGFEIQTTGKAYIASYASGVRRVIQDLSAATGNAKQPSDGAQHKWYNYFRGDLSYYALDMLDSYIGSMPNGTLGPNVNALPICFLMAAGSTAPTTALTFTCAAVFLGDTARNTVQLADGQFPYRKAKVSFLPGQNSDGAIITDIRNCFNANRTQPTPSTSAFTILAQNAFRISAMVANRTSGNVYYSFGSATITIANASDFLAPGERLIIDKVDPYSGIIQGICSAVPTGTLYVTELIP